MKRVLLLLTLSPILLAEDYKVICEAARWKGNSLSTSDQKSDIEFESNGIQFEDQIFEFSTPAEFGDPVQIINGSKKTQGIVTYFYDHTKWLADESYIIILSQPKQILERNVIQIDSGWTHLTYTVAYGGFGEDELSTQSFANKCNLSRVDSS